VIVSNDVRELAALLLYEPELMAQGAECSKTLMIIWSDSPPVPGETV